MLRKALMLSAILGLLAGCSNSGPYSRKDGEWRFEKDRVPVPAGETLTPLNNRFARSKTMVFYRASPIPDMDAGSFEALSDHYARDRGQVIWADTYRKGQEYYSILHTRITPLEGADPASFVALDQDYGRDRARVWFEGKPFAADAATFEVLDYGFGHDTVSGYYMRAPIPGSDGKSFEIIDNEWSKEAGRVFWSDIDLTASPPALVNRTAEGADPKTFKALEGGYGKDATRVFFRGKVVEGADPASFEVGEGSWAGDAHDKYRGYREGVAAVTPVVPPTPDAGADET